MSIKLPQTNMVPVQARHSATASPMAGGLPTEGRRQHLANFGNSVLTGLKNKSQEGAGRVAVVTAELGRLLGHKMKDEVGKQMTAEHLLSAAKIVGKAVGKGVAAGAPLMAAGPAALPAAIALAVTVTGKEVAQKMVEKTTEKVAEKAADPDFHKKVLTEGIGMIATAFSSPAISSHSVETDEDEDE